MYMTIKKEGPLKSPPYQYSNSSILSLITNTNFSFLPRLKLSETISLCRK